jgi:hypothetical protein
MEKPRQKVGPHEHERRVGSDSAAFQHALIVQNRSVGSLHLDRSNSRVHTNKQVQQIANSINKFGFNVPILIDDQSNVIAGHGRLLASRFLGMADVPTICLGHLTPNQIRAFMIADNRLTENSTWNRALWENNSKLCLRWNWTSIWK